MSPEVYESRSCANRSGILVLTLAAEPMIHTLTTWTSAFMDLDTRGNGAPSLLACNKISNTAQVFAYVGANRSQDLGTWTD